MILQKLYPYRFEIFFFSQITILFGSLIFPLVFFEEILSPILFQVNLLAGILLIMKHKKWTRFFIILFIIVAIVFLLNLINHRNNALFDAIRMGVYFLFYVVVAFEIIRQVWKAVHIGSNVILGLISGYISLGLLGFFICYSIEMKFPGSFHGLEIFSSNMDLLTDKLLYFSYITLLTIGYGDIFPVTTLAQKATMLIGLMGQIYLVILTAIVVGKYINQNAIKQ